MTTRTLLVLVLVASCAALPTRAQQLILNPEFDSTIDGWANDQATTQDWCAEDAKGQASSGSLRATSQDPVGNSNQHFATHDVHPAPPHCVAVTPGETLYASVMYKSDAVTTRIYLNYYADATCAYSFPAYSAYIAWGGPTSSWRTLRGSVLIPLAGIGAVLFAVNATSNNTATPFTIGLDHAYMGRTPRLLSDGFECGSAYEWSAVTP